MITYLPFICFYLFSALQSFVPLGMFPYTAKTHNGCFLNGTRRPTYKAHIPQFLPAPASSSLPYTHICCLNINCKRNMRQAHSHKFLTSASPPHARSIPRLVIKTEWMSTKPSHANLQPFQTFNLFLIVHLRYFSRRSTCAFTPCSISIVNFYVSFLSFLLHLFNIFTRQMLDTRS